MDFFRACLKKNQGLSFLKATGPGLSMEIVLLEP